MASIRIEDELYEFIKSVAEEENRSVTNMVDTMIKQYKGLKTFSSPETVSETHASIPTERTKGDILADIREVNSQRDQELEYCQDSEVAKQIADKYQSEIDSLWSEYNNIR